MKNSTRPSILRWICWPVLFLGLTLVIPYLGHTVFRALPKRPFVGAHWYNPYSAIADTALRANFHAHSRAWSGLTWGENTAAELIAAYADHGYAIPALSNYHKITPRESYIYPLIHIPTYEHGYNLNKVHCLCIGARRVSFFDYPLHLSIHHTQQIINHLRKQCDLVALAHPGARNAHQPEAMPRLVGLHLMEVANTQGVRTQYWDEILSAGQAVWFLANDDTHDLQDGEAFMRWNMILASERSPEGVIDALRQGRSYGIASYDGKWEQNHLREVSIVADTLRLRTQRPFNRLDFIGQGGVSRHSVSRDSSAVYVLQPQDTYVRVEIHHDHSVMYLNPVIRYDGKVPPHDIEIEPQIDQPGTWAARSVILLLIGILTFFWLRTLKRRRVSKTKS